MLGESPLHHLYWRARAEGVSELTLEQLYAEPRQVQKVDLHCSPADLRSPPRSLGNTPLPPHP